MLSVSDSYYIRMLVYVLRVAHGDRGAVHSFFELLRPPPPLVAHTTNKLNNFLWPSVRHVLETFLKTQGTFSPVRHLFSKLSQKHREVSGPPAGMLFVAGKFRLSADSRFRFRPFASTPLNRKLKTVFSFNWRHTPFCVLRCFVVRNFSCLRTKNGFFLSRNFSGCELSEQNGTVCGQEFFANSW